MDFMDLREGKKILTCYQTGNKHATSIMEKLLKKIKKKFKNSRTKFSLRSMCSLLPQSSSYYLKKKKKILSIAIIFRIFLEEPHRSFKKTIKKKISIWPLKKLLC